jgi:hypothetical protein
MEILGRGDDYELRFSLGCIFIGPRHQYMIDIERNATFEIKIGRHRPILVMTAIKTYAATLNFKLKKIMKVCVSSRFKEHHAIHDVRIDYDGSSIATNR